MSVSIVMAAKNYARFLPEAVRSVQAQTHTDWDLQIIDDGSTDATPAAVRSFLADPRVRYVRSDKLGQPRAKNLGVHLTRGEYVAFLDADDAWEPEKLTKQLAELAKSPETGVCYTLRSLMDEASQPMAINAQSRTTPHVGWVRRAIFEKNFICFSSVVVRRQVFEHLGGFEPRFDLAIDYDFWLRVSKHYPVVAVTEPLVRYRTGHGNLSKKLSDRVLTADVIMTRALQQQTLGDDVPAEVAREGMTSLYLALAFAIRRMEPWRAIRTYAEAFLQRPSREALQGILGTAKDALRGRRDLVIGENAAVNR
ncbi:MAG: glycosyltransferase family 2 protein [Fimbriiglobus sp.]